MPRQEQDSMRQPLHQTPQNKVTRKSVRAVVNLLLAGGQFDPGASDEDGLILAETGAELVVKLLSATGKVQQQVHQNDAHHHARPSEYLYQSPLPPESDKSASISSIPPRDQRSVGLASSGKSRPLRTIACSFGRRKTSFSCPHQECVDEHGEPAKFFSRKAGVQRHLATAHNRQYFDCPIRRCARKGPNGFSRQDHLTEHLRGYHRENLNIYGRKCGVVNHSDPGPPIRPFSFKVSRQGCTLSPHQKFSTLPTRFIICLHRPFYKTKIEE